MFVSPERFRASSWTPAKNSAVKKSAGFLRSTSSIASRHADYRDESGLLAGLGRVAGDHLDPAVQSFAALVEGVPNAIRLRKTGGKRSSRHPARTFRISRTGNLNRLQDPESRNLQPASCSASYCKQRVFSLAASTIRRRHIDRFFHRSRSGVD